MKTAEDFKKVAKEKNLARFHVHRCSMCKYPCDYVFSPDHEHVGFDIGCDCTRRYIVNPSSYEDIAHYYNMQKNPGHIKELNDFWGFPNE
jgi:hypothetical protein